MNESLQAIFAKQGEAIAIAENLREAEATIQELPTQRQLSNLRILQKVLRHAQENQKEMDEAKKRHGDVPLQAILKIHLPEGENPHYSIRLIPEGKEPQKGELTMGQTETLLSLANGLKPTHAQQIKSAFIYLIQRFGAGNYKDFRYSIPSKNKDRVTGYISLEEAREPTISHDEALKIVQASPNPLEILQTKTYITFPQEKLIALKKIVRTQAATRYEWEIFNYHQEKEIRKNNLHRILWPLQQKAELESLLKNAIALLLNKASESLGEGKAGFLVLFERDYGKKILTKGIIAPGENKKEANETAKAAIMDCWPHFGEEVTTFPITCLTRKECNIILQQLQKR